MAVSLSTRQAYSEVEQFLSLLEEEQINKIPKQLRELFKEEKDYNYKKIIDPNQPIKDQNLKGETLAIIALLNLEYWCEDEQEKERLRKVYSNNEKAYEEVFQIAFDPDKVFNKSTERSDSYSQEKSSVIPYKESFVRKIINKIKDLFKR